MLVAVWLWLAFSSGGFLPRQWLLPALALGLLGIVASLLAVYPGCPRRSSLAVLALFGGYSLWVAASSLWAFSVNRVWLETGRTFAYLLIFALALTYFSAPGARRVFRYLLAGAALVILALCVWRLWGTSETAGLFISNRFSYPVSYPNNAAALFLVSFWPLMWLASDPKGRAWVRGACLGLATGLLGLGILTFSRGGIYSLAISLVLMFVLSPARLRLVTYLAVPVLLLVYGFPRLNRYWVEGPAAIGGGLGARTILLVSVAAAVAGCLLAFSERWVRVRGRVKTVVGAAVLVVCVAGAVYGVSTLTASSGGPIGWASKVWQGFTAEGSAQPASTQSIKDLRFIDVSSSGRVEIWKVAWSEFEVAPWVGAGADNFVIEYNRLRADPAYTGKPKQAHSITLQVLGDTGVMGGILAFGGVLLAAVGVLWPRYAAAWRRARRTWLRRRAEGASARAESDGRVLSAAAAEGGGADSGDDPTAYGWEIALFVGVAYWFIHANVEWLWQMAGVTIPAVLMLAAALAGVDARAGRAEGSSASGGAALPSGLLSWTYRVGLGLVAAALLALAGLSYLSMQLEDSALAVSRTDSLKAAQRVASAGRLVPGDPGPWAVQASIYAYAARKVADSSQVDKAGTALDDLALTIGAQQKTIDKDPADWTNHYRAAWSTLDLLFAKTFAEGGEAAGTEARLLAQTLSGTDLSGFLNGQHDWSGLAGGMAVPPVGAAGGSLAKDAASQAAAARYRDLSPKDLRDLALRFISAARRLNPMEPTVTDTIRFLEGLPQT